MTHRPRTRVHAHAHGQPRIAVAVVIACALALAGCAQSSNTTSTPGAPPSASTPTSPTGPPAATTTGSPAPGSAHGLSVTPAVGTPQSVMHFVVTPTTPTGAPGDNDISNALSVMGPQKAGCVGVHQQGLSALPPGQPTTVSLGPAQLGGNWCPGTYTARVAILERPKCGQGQMCPQFIRVLAVLGPVSFTISR